MKKNGPEAKDEGFDLVGSLLYAIALFAIMYGFSLLPVMEGGILNRPRCFLSGLLYFSAIKKSFPFIGYSFVFR